MLGLSTEKERGSLALPGTLQVLVNIPGSVGEESRKPEVGRGRSQHTYTALCL